MESEIQENKKKEKANGGMEYDDAVAAYAEFMSIESSEVADLKIAAKAKAQAAADK